jgi:hypothetical protein
MRIGGFKIIIPNVIVINYARSYNDVDSLVDSICTRNCMATKSFWSSLYLIVLWSKSYPKRDLKDCVELTSSILSFNILMHDSCGNNLQSTLILEYDAID